MFHVERFAPGKKQKSPGKFPGFALKTMWKNQLIVLFLFSNSLFGTIISGLWIVTKMIK